MDKIKNSNKIDMILREFPNPQKSDLGRILLKIQGHFGFLNQEILKKIGQYVGVSATEAYGYASFYSLYYLEKPGKYIIKICKGTACHLKQSQRLVQDVEKYLDIQVGQTSADGLFKLELVSCLGICASAPVIKINDRIYPRASFKSVKLIIDEIKKNESDEKGTDEMDDLNGKS